MTTIVRARSVNFAGVLGALGAVALLAGCQTPEAPPVALAPPPVALPERAVQAAAAYHDYVLEASAITADFTDGDSVANKIRIGAAYEAQQMQRGVAAYGAIVALQEPTFVSGVQAYTADPAIRTQVVADLMKDPAYVLGIKGAEAAASRVANALNDQGSMVKAAGDRVKQSAYDVQKMAWSKRDVADRPGRLAQAKALSRSPRSASPDLTAKLQLASVLQGPMPMMGETTLTTTDAPAAAPPASIAPPYTPVVVRSLAAAALAVLGEGGEANSDNIWAVLAEPNQSMCYNLAKLNLYQCLSVAKPHFEDVFCLGQHILMDTGACVIKGAGVQKSAPLVFAERATAVSYESTQKAPASRKPAKK